MIHYFKQAWNLIRQEKLFSSLYILGTGLSITVVMVLSIVFYLKIANIYPETNRDRMLTVRKAVEKSKEKNGSYNSSRLSPQVVETCFRSLKSAEVVTATLATWGDENYVQPDGSQDQWPVAVKYVDTQFWTVFPYRFVDGKPFTEADFQSAIPVAVIAESLAKRLFGDAEAVGKQVSMDFRSFRVCGVVKDASFVTERTYAQLWAPYTVNPESKASFGPGGSLGRLMVYILAPSVSAVEQVRREAIENLQRYSQTLKDLEFTVNGQPDRYWQMVLRDISTGMPENPDFTKDLMSYGLIFFILLLVPAVSLSGMTDSRIERRMAEMGVRRAFGAPVHRLMGQIISENFLFTLLGGAVGLLTSWLFILLGRQWIMKLGEHSIDIPPEGTDVVFSPSMLMNLPVFAITLGICFVLNLLSSLIPAWRYSRREIIHSLNLK
jgi:putative ABC transport system permease protein